MIVDHLMSLVEADVHSADRKSLGVLCGGIEITSEHRPGSAPAITWSRGSDALGEAVFLDIWVWGGDLSKIHNRIYALLHDQKKCSYDSSGPTLWDARLGVFHRRARYFAGILKI